MEAERTIDNLISEKKEAKAQLAGEMGFSRKKPLVGIFLDRSLPAKDEKNLKELLKGAGVLDIEIVIVGDRGVDSNVKGVNFLEYNRVNRKKLLNAADIAVVFSFNDVEEMFFNGVIPVSSERKETENYNPNQESGNSFVYEVENAWGIFGALVRAVETFKFPYDWKHIIREALGQKRV